MEDIKEKKIEILHAVEETLSSFSKKEFLEKGKRIETRLFEFANFIEAKVVLLYINRKNEVDTNGIIRRCLDYNKVIVVPALNTKKFEIKLMKIDDLHTDLEIGPEGTLSPDPDKCKIVPIDCIDIAIIPGIAFDEKGGRIGLDEGYYNKLIPKLPITTRKIALAFEEQIYPPMPMESKNRHVDIIITDKRIIYKI